MNNENIRIPKIIHYCWFGGNPLPESAKKYIESWKKHCPDYEIKEWNESNFDIRCCSYVKEVYEAKKWAFVSDYARFWILFHYGGLYFDTDVEILRPLDDLLTRGSFMGCEPTVDSNQGKKSLEFNLAVNPGLGFAAEPGMALFRELLDIYEKKHYIQKDGSKDPENVVTYTTRLLKENGFTGNGLIEEVGGIVIYPPEYLCPKNYWTGELRITEHTYSIHHYSESWLSTSGKIVAALERAFSHYGKWGYCVQRVLSLPFRIIRKMEMIGIKNTVFFVFQKIRKQ